MPERTQIPTAPDKTAEVQVTTLRGGTLMRLKSWLPEHSTGAKSVALAGLELPSQVGATLSSPIRTLCVGPGEWLIMSHKYQASRLRELLEPDLAKYGLALVDLTDGLAGLDILGGATREVLSKGCGLDLHPRSFPVGRCARTRFAQIPAVVECLDEQRFELHVARSYLQYLHSWLLDAAIEFQST